MTPAEKRDASLRTVELPDCCGNCRHMTSTQDGVLLCTQSDMFIAANLLDLEDEDYRFHDNVQYNQLCNLHERKPDGGSE